MVVDKNIKILSPFTGDANDSHWVKHVHLLKPILLTFIFEIIIEFIQ